MYSNQGLLCVLWLWELGDWVAHQPRHGIGEFQQFVLNQCKELGGGSKCYIHGMSVCNIYGYKISLNFP